jgi:uncharacterized protein
MDNRHVYRNSITSRSLKAFHVLVKETDLQVHSLTDFKKETTELVLKYRGYIESFIDQHPDFENPLLPWTKAGVFPGIIEAMILAGKKAGVGPMAAVAGAVAQCVGQDLLSLSPEVIVENGGDIFIKTQNPVIVGIYTGHSPLNMKIGLKIDSGITPKGVCTSSGILGHSLSFGKADAVAVVSDSCPLADAAATAIANKVKSRKDIERAIEFGCRIPGVSGMVVIKGEAMGAWGDVELVDLEAKKG